MCEDLTSVLEGKVVRLEPLGRRHEEGLYEAAQDARIWRWMPYDASESREVFHAWLEDALAASTNPKWVHRIQGLCARSAK